ncbi:uncharacterized protein ACB058_001699 [Synchiropus picturatus]
MWYLAADCAYPVHKTAFGAGFGATLVGLVLTVAGLTSYKIIKKQRLERKRDLKEKLVNHWLKEDFQWSRSNSSTGPNNSDDYRNPTYIHDEWSTSTEEQRSQRPTPVYRANSAPLYSNNRQPSPAWDSRPGSDGHSPPSTGNSINSNWRMTPSNPPMRITRPQVRTLQDK